MFKHHRKLLIIALLSYVATTLNLPASYGLVAVMIGSALNIVMIPVFGAVSDRAGRKNNFFIGAAVIIVSALPIFAMIESDSHLVIIAGVAIFLTLGHPVVYAVLPAFYCELFPRLSGTPASMLATKPLPFS